MAICMSSETTVIPEVPNLPHFKAKVVEVVNAGTPVQLPSIPIPDGSTLVLRACRDNGKKKIYLANSAANTANTENRITLSKGEAFGLTVNNANVIWVNSDGNGVHVEVVTESETETTTTTTTTSSTTTTTI